METLWRLLARYKITRKRTVKLFGSNAVQEVIARLHYKENIQKDLGGIGLTVIRN